MKLPWEELLRGAEVTIIRLSQNIRYLSVLLFEIIPKTDSPCPTIRPWD
jgi:hypothetical protein